MGFCRPCVMSIFHRSVTGNYAALLVIYGSSVCTWHRGHPDTRLIRRCAARYTDFYPNGTYIFYTPTRPNKRPDQRRLLQDSLDVRSCMNRNPPGQPNAPLLKAAIAGNVNFLLPFSSLREQRCIQLQDTAKWQFITLIVLFW